MSTLVVDDVVDLALRAKQAPPELRIVLFAEARIRLQRAGLDDGAVKMLCLELERLARHGSEAA